jgi:hypothetical protein
METKTFLSTWKILYLIIVMTKVRKFCHHEKKNPWELKGCRINWHVENGYFWKVDTLWSIPSTTQGKDVIFSEAIVLYYVEWNVKRALPLSVLAEVWRCWDLHSRMNYEADPSTENSRDDWNSYWRLEKLGKGRVFEEILETTLTAMSPHPCV